MDTYTQDSNSNDFGNICFFKIICLFYRNTLGNYWGKEEFHIWEAFPSAIVATRPIIFSGNGGFGGWWWYCAYRTTRGVCTGYCGGGGGWIAQDTFPVSLPRRAPEWSRPKENENLLFPSYNIIRALIKIHIHVCVCAFARHFLFCFNFWRGNRINV